MLESDLNSTSSAFIVDTSKFSSEDLDLFLNSSKFIEETREKRRVSQLCPINAKSVYKSREEIYEVSEVNEKEFCEIASSAYDDIAVNIKNLSADIEKLFKDLDGYESGCCSAESDVEVPVEKKTLESKVVSRCIQRNKNVVTEPKSVAAKPKSVVAAPKSAVADPSIKSNSSGKWPPKQNIEQTVNQIEFAKSKRAPNMNVQARMWPPKQKIEPAVSRMDHNQKSDLAPMMTAQTRMWPPKQQIESAASKIEYQDPDCAPMLKVKDMVLFFNQLSTHTTKQLSENNPQEELKSTTEKIVLPRKSGIRQTAPIFAKLQEPTTTQHCSIKDDVRVKVETPKPSKNLVKNRINQFEAACRGEISQRPTKSIIKKHGSNLCDLAKNSVRKIRVLFEQGSAKPKSPEESNDSKSTKDVPKQGTHSIKSSRPKFVVEISRLYMTSTKSPIPQKQVFKRFPKSEDDLKKPCEDSSFPCHDSSSKPSNISISASCIKTSSPIAESTPKQPNATYNSFIESDKSAQKLCNLVHTIRSIRDQGMTDVSRDLFHIFKKCLCVASEKLADPKQQLTIHDSASKRVAAIKPTVNTTFPRVLKAIPKKRNSDNIEMKLWPAAFRQEMNKKGLNESSLTYERFVSILGQTTHGRD